MSAALELSLLLTGEDVEKIHCPASRRDKWGHVAVTCTLGIGHEGDEHVDVHAGRKWVQR